MLRINCLLLMTLGLIFGTSLGDLNPQFAFAYVPNSTPIPQTLVKFEVEIPNEISPGEGVEIMVFDEVSGLLLNPRRYVMYAKDAKHFQIELPFQVGAIVKYRYIRHGDSDKIEFNAKNKAVRYRLFRVEGAGAMVRDVVAAWADTQETFGGGTLRGKITDRETAKPIEGIMVFCGGDSTITDVKGEFEINPIVSGKHLLVAYTPDGRYQPFQQEAIIVSEKVTTAIFSLQRSSFVPLVFYVEVPQDTPNQAQVRIAGNLLQLGNVYRELQGGVSGDVNKMPVLKKTGDNSFITAVNLPIGSFVEYKYTLGNGYWNAERDEQGSLVLRQMIIPPQGRIIRDKVISWQDVRKEPYSFMYTDTNDNHSRNVALQFFAYQWSEPIPMWQVSKSQWMYVLYSPLGIFQDKPKVQYCIDGVCGN